MSDNASREYGRACRQVPLPPDVVPQKEARPGVPVLKGLAGATVGNGQTDTELKQRPALWERTLSGLFCVVEPSNVPYYGALILRVFRWLRTVITWTFQHRPPPWV